MTEQTDFPDVDAEPAADPALEADGEAASADDRAALFESNMAVFEKRFPGLHHKLKDHRVVSKLVIKDNGEPSVVFKDFDLYPEGGQTHANMQVEQYKAHSRRLTLSELSASGLDFHSAQFYKRLTQRFNDSGFKFTHQPYRDGAYFVTILGLGLGLHLEGIVDRTGCRVLTIVEPNLDFIYHSLSVLDWAALIDRFLDQGQVQIFIDSDPEQLVQQIKSIFRAHNPTGLDGAVLFRHYRSTIFSETDKNLYDELRTAVMGLGFYQDEINMIGQTFKNLESGTARIMRKIPENPGIPVFIVANGPSLDMLLPFVQENAENAVIIAAGSSLDTLLSNGVMPDFWVMMERHKVVYDVLVELSENHDLSTVRFAGSTTIFPGVPELFREAVLFFRPGLSPAPLFATSRDEVAEIPDPVAANAGLSFALSAGFSEIYLLGVDCGSHDPNRGHASGGWYDRQKAGADPIKNLGISHKGNFGGTVWTTNILQWSRENLEKLITTSRGHLVFNLGNGALIKGATPKHPKAVELAEPPRPKQDMVDEFVARYPVYTREKFEATWEKVAIIDRLPEFCDKLKDAVRQSENLGDFSYVHDTMKLLKPAQSDDALAMLLRGTLFTSISAFEFLFNRAVDPAEQEAIAEVFRDEYCDFVDQLCDRAVELFLQLEDGMEWEDEFYE